MHLQVRVHNRGCQVKVHKQRTDSFFEILRPTLGVSIGGDRGLAIQLEMQLVMVQTDCNDMSI